jgi:hypothetical protein
MSQTQVERLFIKDRTSLVCGSFRLTTNLSTSGAVITSNWEAADDASSGTVGSAITQSSGIFTFPSTGVYNIMFGVTAYDDADSRYVGAQIEGTSNNSDYDALSLKYDSFNVISPYSWCQISSHALFDCTDTTTHKLMSYIGRGLQSGAFRQLDDISSGFDGSDTTHTMQVNSTNVTVGDVNQILLSLGGVIQKPGTDFTVSSSTLTFTTAPAANTSFFAVLLGSDNGGTVTPTDKSVTVGKIDINGGELFLDADDDTSITADTDDQIDFKAGGTDIMSLTATTATINDGVTISVADNTDNLTLTSTDADANAGPNLRLYRNSSSPADHDIVGQIDFEGRNDNSEDIVYAKIFGSPKDVSDGTEDGGFFLHTMLAGSDVSRMGMSSSQTVFNDDGNDIDFRVENDAGGNLLNVQAVNTPFSSSTTGCVGINSANSDGNMFEVINPGAGVYTIKSIASASSGGIYTLGLTFNSQAPDDNTSSFIIGNDTTTVKFRVYSDGDVVNHDNSYGSISDERIKSNIVDANSQWDDIKALKIRNYKKNDDIAQYGDKAWVQLGVIAQELEAAGMDKCVKQEVLYTSDDQEVAINKTAKEGDIKEYKSVKYSILYMKAIKALQEAMAKIEALEADVKTLKGE